MKRTIIITALVVIFTSAGLVVFVKLTSGENNKALNFAEARRGDFEISVSNTGELVAENSVDIKGPNIVNNMNFRAAAVKILDIVPEGTIVKKGDYIANLDRTNFNNTLKDEIEILKKNQTDLEMKILDTAVVLSSLRDEIRNQQFIVEEASVTLDQSKFEPPAVQRQASLRLDKEKRLYTQRQKLYSLRSAQSSSEIRTLRVITGNQQRKVNDLQTVLAGFTITSPGEGMIIYKKDRMGNKIKSGSVLNPFDPVVATLPDLSSMLSKMYVSEIEVTKISKGLPVQISIDALQGKNYKGKVVQIANIGEQLSNSDSKVFEVLVKLDGSDPQLRPSMTASNKIVTKLYSDVVFIPEECLHTDIDSIPYVYTKDGTKQIVIAGESNEKNIIVAKGLKPGDLIWIITPDNIRKFTLAGNDLITEIKAKDKSMRMGLKNMRSGGSSAGTTSAGAN